MKLEQLNKFLYAAKTKKNEGYRSYFNEHYKLIQGFCVFSILKLFRPMERQRLVEISQSIINIFEQANYAKMQDVYMPKRGMYKAYWVELTESEIHKIEPKLAQLKLILQGNNQALFLAENQNKIDKVLNERQEYIDQQANLLFKEKLPRFLSSAFAKEAHALKKSIKRREYLFGSAIVFLQYCYLGWTNHITLIICQCCFRLYGDYGFLPKSSMRINISITSINIKKYWQKPICFIANK